MKQLLNRAYATIGVIACLALIAADRKAQEMVKEAKVSYDRAAKAANDAHSDALTVAATDYIRKLRTALDAAFEAKDLDQANLINAEIKSFEARTKSPGPDRPKALIARAKLTDALVNTKWPLYGTVLTFNADGTVDRAKLVSGTWAVVEDNQVLAKWPGGSCDLLVFDKDVAKVQKQQIGNLTTPPRHYEEGNIIK